MFKKKALQAVFATLKDSPGVYFFKGADESVLYIGKAKSLKRRVAQYRDSDNPKIAQMVDLAESLNFIETKTELDALVLEAQMIQNHQPPFNVVYRGGRPFLNLVITKGSKKAIPQLLLVREVPDGATVVGRFLHKSLARAMHMALLKVFALRICKVKIPEGCLYWHMGQCAGLCRDDFDLKAYKDRLKNLGEVLTAGFERYWQSVEGQISKACSDLNFEKAKALSKHLELFGQCRDVLQNSWASDQAHLICPPEQKDVWFLWPEKAGLQLIIASYSHVQKKALWLSIEDDASEYIKSYYSSNPIPRSIFTDFEINEKGLFQEFLTIFRSARIGSVSGPAESVIFDKVDSSGSDQVGLAKIIAMDSYRAFLEVPKTLASLVGAGRPVVTIDCFDISHKQGRWIVAACVRFENGRENRAMARNFKVRGLDHSDDYASLSQVVSRRYSDGFFPDLILIDGGKGQLSSVLAVVPKGVCVAALAKREERLFCYKDLSNGVKLDLRSAEGALLIQLRDRTHTSAVGYHSKLFNSSFIDQQ